MRDVVTIVPGATPLSTWRAIYFGAEVVLAPGCRSAVEAGAATVERIVALGAPVYGINTGFGKLASVSIKPRDLATLQRNLVLSHSSGVGEMLPRGVVRLMLALKIGALAQGFSGVRWRTVEQIVDCLARGLLPVVPAQGSCGASGDLAPLAHVTAALIGAGEFSIDGRTLEAPKALHEAGMTPLVLGPKEGLALLNGTQASAALAMAGLFEAERVFRAALVTGAMATDAAKGSDGPFDPRIQTLRGHRGQIDVACALRALMDDSPIRASHRSGHDRLQDPYCLRCQPQVMGACLGVLRHVAETLATEANGVSDNPLVFSHTDEVISGGNFHAEPIAFAADETALALCEIGSLAERRIAMLVDPALSGLPAFLTPRPGLNSGFMIPQVTAAALVSENKQRAYPASVDSIPTSANQEDHVSMATHGARRLLPMADNTVNVIAIELLAASQALEFHAPLKSSTALERVRAAVRARIPALDDDRFMAPDIAAAADLVKSGRVAMTANVECLPSCCGDE